MRQVLQSASILLQSAIEQACAPESENGLHQILTTFCSGPVTLLKIFDLDYQGLEEALNWPASTRRNKGQGISKQIWPCP